MKQFSIEWRKYPGLPWVCLTLLCDWSRKLELPSEPIRFKVKPLTTWSPFFRTSISFFFFVCSLCSLWPFVIFFVTLIGHSDYFGFDLKSSWKALYNAVAGIKVLSNLFSGFYLSNHIAHDLNCCLIFTGRWNHNRLRKTPTHAWQGRSSSRAGNVVVTVVLNRMKQIQPQRA